MNNQNLYIVGTIHVDLDGRERLDTLLDGLSPGIIALEMSKDRDNLDRYRKSPEEEEKEINSMIDKSGLNLNPKQRATLIESEHRINSIIGYELKSPKNYINRNKDSRLEYIDISVFTNGREEFGKGCVEVVEDMLKQLAGEPELAKLLLERLDKGIDAYVEYLREDVQQAYQNAEAIAESFERIIDDSKIFEEMTEDLPPRAVQTLKQIYNPARDEAMSKRVRELYNGKDKLVTIVGLGHLYKLKQKVEDLEPVVMTLAEYNSI